MTSMRALVKEGPRVAIAQVPVPRVSSADQVLIRVVAAGLCRTDVYAAAGRIPARDPVILGHEFSGIVSEAGRGVRHVSPGDRVTALPWIGCGACAECHAPREPGVPPACPRARMLGVNLDGAFAEFVVVPGAVVYPLPDSLPFRTGAYVEPVAASLAVLRAGLSAAGRGLIYGDNRIALLTAKILVAHGFADVSIGRPGKAGDEPADCEYDYVIETTATTDSLRDVLRALRPRGTVVLKSRPCQPAGLDVRAAVLKEVTFRAVNYGSFAAAITLLAEGRLDLGELLGPLYPLEEFENVFAQAEEESTKSFFALAGAAYETR
jgi:L-iditol 2-dehydrogenase